MWPFKKRSTEPPPDGWKPDFSDVDTPEKAAALAREGKLERCYVFPLNMGGHDIPQNVVYVPVGVVAIKAEFDGLVRAALVAGKVSEYEANPEYRGRSVVPTEIAIRAWGPGESKLRIRIW